MEEADRAIARSDWVKAYRFAEDGLISSREDVKARAMQMMRQYPQLIAAAESTFSRESIARTVEIHAPGKGIEVESRRLNMFRVVASDDQYGRALENLQSVAALSVDPLIADSRTKENDSLERERQEAKRKKEQEVAALEYANAVLSAEEAKKHARYRCGTRQACDKSFALTQIFISERADMKIQVATNTIIETYSPTDANRIGMKAIRMPGRGESAEITISIKCRDDGSIASKSLCAMTQDYLYSLYPKFLASAMR
ncbi:hypothetical protein GO611_16985 [Azoarcus communis SWub3 = DSM 12120]|nr:hypothetical protein [Parazoarcus communis SWub3 = DSM 12120]